MTYIGTRRIEFIEWCLRREGLSASSLISVQPSILFAQQLFTQTLRMIYRLQPADEEFSLVDHLGREVVVKSEEELFMVHYLASPSRSIDLLQLVERLAGEVQPL